MKRSSKQMFYFNQEQNVLVGSITPLTANNDLSLKKITPKILDFTNTYIKAILSVNILKIITYKKNISFLYIQTKNGGQRKNLNEKHLAIVSFYFINDSPTAVYFMYEKKLYKIKLD